MPAVALLSAVFCPSNAPKFLGSSICAWIFVVASAELMLSTSRSSTCSGGTHASTSIWSQASGRLGPAVQLPILHRSPVHWNAKQRPVPFHRCPLGCGTFFLLSCPSKFIYHCLCIRAHQLLSFAAFPSQHLVIDPFVCTLSLFGALASTTYALPLLCNAGITNTSRALTHIAAFDQRATTTEPLLPYATSCREFRLE
jgi:hypothetical protein